MITTIPESLASRIRVEVSARRKDDGEPHSADEIVAEALEKHLAGIDKRRAEK